MGSGWGAAGGHSFAASGAAREAVAVHAAHMAVSAHEAAVAPPRPPKPHPYPERSKNLPQHLRAAYAFEFDRCIDHVLAFENNDPAAPPLAFLCGHAVKARVNPKTGAPIG
jgi:hypothetical protein